MAATATPESGTKDKNYDLITVSTSAWSTSGGLSSTPRTQRAVATRSSRRCSGACRSTAVAVLRNASSCSQTGCTRRTEQHQTDEKPDEPCTTSGSA